MAQKAAAAAAAAVPVPVTPSKLTGKKIAGWGCLSLLFLVLALVGAGAYQWTREMNRPFDRQTVLTQYGGLPVFPQATLDLETTRALRGGAALTKLVTGGKPVEVWAFRSAETNGETVATWFDVQLSLQGWRIARAQESLARTAPEGQARRYQNGGQFVIVQVSPDPDAADPGGRTLITVTRLSRAPSDNPYRPAERTKASSAPT